jgi:hypothetical protein
MALLYSDPAAVAYRVTLRGVTPVYAEEFYRAPVADLAAAIRGVLFPRARALPAPPAGTAGNPRATDSARLTDQRVTCKMGRGQGVPRAAK